MNQPLKLAAGRPPFPLKKDGRTFNIPGWRVSWIIRAYARGRSIERIAAQLGITSTPVRRLLLLHRARIRNASEWAASHRSTNPRAYAVDESFFDSPLNERSAYWLGFILGDGCIKNGGCLYIALHRQDRAHLHRFLDHAGSAAPVKEVPQNGQVLVTIGSQRWKEALKKFEVVPKKSIRHAFPNVPKKWARHVIRGLFDADGCICQALTGPYYTRQWIFSICGSARALNVVSRIIHENTGIDCAVYTKGHRCRKGFGSLVKRGNASVPRILDWIFEDATVYLQRKFELYQQMKQVLADTEILRRTNGRFNSEAEIIAAKTNALLRHRVRQRLRRGWSKERANSEPKLATWSRRRVMLKQ